MLSRHRFAAATATVAIALVGTVMAPSVASASTHHHAGKAKPNGTSWTHAKPGGTSWTHLTPNGTAWTVRTPAGTAWT